MDLELVIWERILDELHLSKYEWLLERALSFYLNLVLELRMAARTSDHRLTFNAGIGTYAGDIENTTHSIAAANFFRRRFVDAPRCRGDATVGAQCQDRQFLRRHGNPAGGGLLRFGRGGKLCRRAEAAGRTDRQGRA